MFLIDDAIARIDLEWAMQAVSDERRACARRFRREADQRGSLAAYLLLRHALREGYGIDEMPVLVYNQHGKPSLAGHPDLYISLSHSEGAVAVAVDTAPVGIDIEVLALPEPDVVAFTMNEGERELISHADDPAVQFVTLWTMKESLLKMSGEGLRDDMRTVLADSDYYQFDVIRRAHHVCTMCSPRHSSITCPE